VLSAVVAIVIAFRAPVVSPVSPPLGAVSAPVPTPGAGLLDMLGDLGTRGNRGGGRGR
jgi:hypothetical protein